MKRKEKTVAAVRADYIDKGVYSHKQIGGYMTVKQFMVVEREGKRCLILRFENESSLEVNAIEFTVIQRNTSGDVIGSSKIKHTHLSVGAGELYSPESGAVIKPECADFEIEMNSVVSGKYRYVFRGGQVTAHYDRRGYDNGICAVHVHKGEGRAAWIKKYYTRGWLYRLIALGALIAVVISLVAAVVASEIDRENDEYKDSIYKEYVGAPLK